jgi:hypothetical protein
MKKLSMFLVILMLAGVANAAVMNVQVNGQDWDGVSDVRPSDIIVMTFHDDVAAIGGLGAMNVTVDVGDQVANPEGTRTLNLRIDSPLLHVVSTCE